MTLHEGEVLTDVPTVRRLLAEQLPHLAGLPVRQVRSTGTVNAVFRVGEQLCVRLPRLAVWAEDLERELRWLPVLAPRLPLQVPEPVARGWPGEGFPLPWAVYRWIPGEPYDDGLGVDEQEAAHDLAGFVRALRAVPRAPDAPAAGRRPLRELDEATRRALAEAGAVLDGPAATRAWERALEAPAFGGAGGDEIEDDDAAVWVHADLLRPNLLVHGGRLHAVLDFGGVGVGDPAADVIAAWSVLGPRGRAVFRDELDVDDGTWERARGYALHQAALIVPYYATTNPGFVASALRTVAQVLADAR